MYIKIFAQHII